MIEEQDQSHLSEIIKVVNEKYGTEWSEKDRLFVEQVKGDMLNNESLSEQMRVNTKEQVKTVFEKEVVNAFVNRHGRNEKIIGDFMQDQNLRKLIISALLDDIYSRVNE